MKKAEPRRARLANSRDVCRRACFIAILFRAVLLLPPLLHDAFYAAPAVAPCRECEVEFSALRQKHDRRERRRLRHERHGASCRAPACACFAYVLALRAAAVFCLLYAPSSAGRLLRPPEQRVCYARPVMPFYDLFCLRA